MNILIPVLNQYVLPNSDYYNFIAREIISEKDNAVVLELNKLTQYRKIFNNPNIKFIAYQDENQVKEIISENKIDYFFAHASFSKDIIKLRNLLLQEPYFTDVTSIWHEGGFLRSVCKQFDWYGWNALSSLANIDINLLPNITKEEQEFVFHFMNDIFLKQKIESKIDRIYIKHEFDIRQDRVSLIALQVYNDSVLKHFADPYYNGYEWVIDFITKHRDTFFIIKEHPKQKNIWTYGNKGVNWIYLDKNFNLNTVALSFAVDSVVTVNSTVGMEVLFWKPVYIAGKSAYSKFCKHVDDFSNQFEKDVGLLNRFFYYTIMKFHYTDGHNARSLREWFEKLQILKNENRHMLSTLSCS